MTSSFDIPDDLNEILTEILINNDNDKLNHTNEEYFGLQTVPQLCINASPCHGSFTTPENYNTPPSVNYMYSSSPMQYSESGIGDGSIGGQSPFGNRSTPGLLSPLSDYSSSHSPKSSRSSSSSINGEYSVQKQFSQVFQKQIYVDIPEGTKHKYRHAKEMKIGHGGLKGEITLPPDYKTSCYRLNLSVVPSLKSKQQIHPCMLHVTVMNQASKQKRARYRTELKSSKDWRVQIYIEQGKVFYVPNYGTNEKFEIDCLKEDRIILGGNNLQLTIISPLQGKKEAEGIKLVSVIRERIREEQWKIDQTAEQIADAYTSAKANKVDLHKCRLRAQLYRGSFVQYNNMTISHDWEFVEEHISNEIIDGRDQNVGSFDLECMSEPNHCCTKGDFKVILISKYKTATVGKDGNRDMLPPVFPVFIFVDGSGTISRPEHYYPMFKQINIQACDLQIHGGAFIFRVPAQNYDVIEQIKNNGKKLRLALWRSLDGIYSDTHFDFAYHRHYEGCPFCIIRLGNEYRARKLPNGRNPKRPRTSSSEMNPQHQQDCSPDNSFSYAPTSVEQKPGLDRLDFDMSDCEDSIKMGPDLVQDCEPGICYGSLSQYDHRSEMLFDEKKLQQIIHDSCDVEYPTKCKNGEECTYHETDGWSTDENSGVENTSDEDDDDDDNYEDTQRGKSYDVKVLEENDEIHGDALDANLVLETNKVNQVVEDDFISAKDVSKETIPMNADKANVKNENEKFVVLDQETTKTNKEEKSTLYLSLMYIMSLILSVILGWVGGYCSLNSEPIMTIALLAISSGIVLGWYFDNKEEKD